MPPKDVIGLGKRRIKDNTGTYLLSGDGKKIRTNDRNGSKRYRNRNVVPLRESLDEYYDDFYPARNHKTETVSSKTHERETAAYRHPAMKKPISRGTPIMEIFSTGTTSFDRIPLNGGTEKKNVIKNRPVRGADDFQQEEEEEKRLLEKAVSQGKMPIRMLKDPWGFTFADTSLVRRATSENIDDFVRKQNLFGQYGKKEILETPSLPQKDRSAPAGRSAVRIIKEQKELKERKKAAKEEAQYKGTEEYALLCKEIDEAQSADMVELLLAIYTVSHRYTEK